MYSAEFSSIAWNYKLKCCAWNCRTIEINTRRWTTREKVRNTVTLTIWDWYMNSSSIKFYLKTYITLETLAGVLDPNYLGLNIWINISLLLIQYIINSLYPFYVYSLIDDFLGFQNRKLNTSIHNAELKTRNNTITWKIHATKVREFVFNKKFFHISQILVELNMKSTGMGY